MSAIEWLNHIATKHIGGGFASREILIGDSLFDDATTELFGPRGSCDEVIVGGITFRPIRTTQAERDVPLHLRGFGV